MSLISAGSISLDSAFKKGIFSGTPEAVHERESKSTFFFYFAENFIFSECVSLVRGAQR
jgi:hypothetical protein